MKIRLLYSLLIILAIETLLTVGLSWPWTDRPVSPFDILAAIFYVIVNFILGVVFVIPKVTRKIGVAFFFSAVIMPFIFGMLLNWQSYVFENHVYDDDIVYKFKYNGDQYELTFHNHDFEEYLDRVLSPEEKERTDMKNVYEICHVVYDENGKKQNAGSDEDVSIGNYRKVGNNEYVLYYNGFSEISSHRHIYEYKIEGPDSPDTFDTLEFKFRNDTLYGLVKTPLKLNKVVTKQK